MKCVICKSGETRAGTTTITFDEAHMTLVVRGVPAQACQNCGEAYVSEETTAYLLQLVDEAASAGVKVDVREYIAA
ncbi:MAG: type II toxin-antitoxin system MqsA family antitoxin [Anaerolineae bacterium]|nr:type II toxin-antitoxin system MqsA family antitoxin [Anaerolineae bacterium]